MCPLTEWNGTTRERTGRCERDDSAGLRIGGPEIDWPKNYDSGLSKVGELHDLNAVNPI
jgi:hypothetical protein